MSASYNLLDLAEKGYAPPKSAPAAKAVEEQATPRPTLLDKHTKELQLLVNRVFLSPRADAPRRLAFASISNSAASGFTCARAARLLARQNAGHVCVLDGNFAEKNLTSFYFPDRVPQSNVRGTFSREHCVPIEDNLWLAGDWVFRDDQGRFLPLVQIQKHLDALAGIFQYLLIDTAALLHSEDALTLAELAGAVVLMIEANITLRRDADTVAQSLQSQGVRIMGAVLNNWSCPVPSSLYRRI